MTEVNGKGIVEGRRLRTLLHHIQNGRWEVPGGEPNPCLGLIEVSLGRDTEMYTGRKVGTMENVNRMSTGVGDSHNWEGMYTVCHRI